MINFIIGKIYNMQTNMMIQEIIKNTLSPEISFEYARICSKLLRSKPENGRKIIIHVLDNWINIPENTKLIWVDLIEMAGFYPYIQQKNLELTDLASNLRKNYCYSTNIGKHLHQEQLLISNKLSNKNLIVSAPTSFGKSLLIEEVVASKKYKNIIIIQPTLALLDETRLKLKKYRQDYKIIVRTSQKYTEEKGNLFLLTSERVLEYDIFPHIDFLVIDEFYKLSASRDDERSDHLNNAFYKLINLFNPKFYLLGPNIESISHDFCNKYNAEFYSTDYSLIDTQIMNHSKNDNNNSEEELFKLLLNLSGEQTIIYCSSPNKVRDRAIKFKNYLREKLIKPCSQLPITEWMKIHIHNDWEIITTIDFQIGIHDGQLPKHINTSIIKYFNTGALKYLFCTSTIIEGVNTSAKNVVIFDDKKGGVKIDHFDYANIKGRAGRMMNHYIGIVHNFIQIPSKQNFNVDIPFHEQNPINNEVLISLDHHDIKDKNTEQFNYISQIPKEEKAIFKKNGVSVVGQQKILQLISNLDQKITMIQLDNSTKEFTIYELLHWNGCPNYNQLKFIMADLCWDNLLKFGTTYKSDFKDVDCDIEKLWNNLYNDGYINIDGSKTKKAKDTKQPAFPNYVPKKKTKIFTIFNKRKGETTRPSNIDEIITRLFEYINDKSIKSLIDKRLAYKTQNNTQLIHRDELLNEAINSTFQIVKHWFQYKIPKWLSVIDNLQKYICAKNNREAGNYTFLITQLENEFTSDNLSILLEYGIPKSVIEKIKHEIPYDMTEDKVLIKTLNLINTNQVNGLLQYEIEKVHEALD